MFQRRGFLLGSRGFHQSRPTARQRGYDSKWDQARQAWLAQNTRCFMCGARATVVHHLKPHRMGQARTEAEKAEARRIFWSKADWRPVCQPCHDGPLQAQEARGYHGNPNADGMPADSNHPWLR